MAGYRFCRSDDVPLLVDAFNACAHSLGMPFEPLTVERFKELSRSLDLWTSSCMIAIVQGEPIAVLLAAKREEANLILSVLVHAEHQRQGHGRHLLTSLGQKMAILGPSRLVAELPESAQPARNFFEACGYRQETVVSDYSQAGRAAPLGELASLVGEAGFDELHAAGALAASTARCWERAPESLWRRRAELKAIAIGSERRVEAHLLYREEAGGGAEVAAVGCADRERALPLSTLLLRAIAAETAGRVRFPKVHPEEVPVQALKAAGFEPGERTLIYAARAVGREEIAGTEAGAGW
ncbi:MAG TPA: GNAT family N-acetyltransferase [Thermoanaerobaculia bacterium]|nr:GNAT family N-acetyltransferase [Thermoanaerobaculia bacterium]